MQPFIKVAEAISEALRDICGGAMPALSIPTSSFSRFDCEEMFLFGRPVVSAEIGRLLDG
jgi:hypothetical protein